MMMTAWASAAAVSFIVFCLLSSLAYSFSPPGIGGEAKRRSSKQPLIFASQQSDTSSGSRLPTRANELIQALWGEGSGKNDAGNNINRIATACSDNVVWEDMRLKKSVEGKDAVSNLLKTQLPRGTTISLDKVSDGASSAGFTWTRKCNNGEKQGLRGTTYVALNAEGKIECVKELAEPIVKPGDIMLKLLQAATKNVPRPEKNPTYARENPKSCSEIVDYIWNRAYPNDAPVDEAMRFFATDIVYQDFNYPAPIVGLADVETFTREWGDFPGIEFRIQDLSDGDLACCFTWRVKVNGKEGPQGISFYETDGQGRITYIRDTPAPSFKPIFGTLARILRPKLRTFRSRKDMVNGIPKGITQK